MPGVFPPLPFFPLLLDTRFQHRNISHVTGGERRRAVLTWCAKPRQQVSHPWKPGIARQICCVREVAVASAAPRREGAQRQVDAEHGPYPPADQHVLCKQHPTGLNTQPPLRVACHMQYVVTSPELPSPNPIPHLRFPFEVHMRRDLSGGDPGFSAPACCSLAA
eukprot:365042-Chlamydomonas_euryale.AAC.37